MLVSTLTFKSSNAFDRLVIHSCMLSPPPRHIDLSYSAPSNSSAAQTVRSLSTDSPSRSVIESLEVAGLDEAPVLVTTADHALLDDAMLDEFFAGCAQNPADLSLAN